MQTASRKTRSQTGARHSASMNPWIWMKTVSFSSQRPTCRHRHPHPHTCSMASRHTHGGLTFRLRCWTVALAALLLQRNKILGHAFHHLYYRVLWAALPCQRYTTPLYTHPCLPPRLCVLVPPAAQARCPKTLGQTRMHGKSHVKLLDSARLLITFRVTHGAILSQQL